MLYLGDFLQASSGLDFDQQVFHVAVICGPLKGHYVWGLSNVGQ